MRWRKEGKKVVRQKGNLRTVSWWAWSPTAECQEGSNQILELGFSPHATSWQLLLCPMTLFVFSSNHFPSLSDSCTDILAREITRLLRECEYSPILDVFVLSPVVMVQITELYLNLAISQGIYDSHICRIT